MRSLLRGSLTPDRRWTHNLRSDSRLPTTDEGVQHVENLPDMSRSTSIFHGPEVTVLFEIYVQLEPHPVRNAQGAARSHPVCRSCPVDLQLEVHERSNSLGPPFVFRWHCTHRPTTACGRSRVAASPTRPDPPCHVEFPKPRGGAAFIGGECRVAWGRQFLQRQALDLKAQVSSPARPFSAILQHA